MVRRVVPAERPAPLETALYVDEPTPEPLVYGFGTGAVAVSSDPCPGMELPHRNEDAIATIRFTANEAAIAVADGAGGMPCGADASKSAVTALRRAIDQASRDGRSLRAGILDGFEQADQAVRDLGVGAATTLAVAEIGEEKLRSYHAGDSAIAVFGQRGRVKLTIVPHSPVGYGVEAGLISPEDALHHDDLNLVSNFVGGTEGMRIEIGPALTLAARDTVVVGTDGLFDNLHLEEVGNLVRTGPIAQAASRLRETCLARMQSPVRDQPSKPDDLAFALYRRTGG